MTEAQYILQVLIYIEVFAVLAVSLNLTFGYMGFISIAHAAFFGIGAYCAALAGLHQHTDVFLNCILAGGLGAVSAAIVAVPIMRAKDDYLVIALFAFQVVTFNIMNNWMGVTGGPLGLTAIPRPTILGIEITNQMGFLCWASVLLAGTAFAVRRIVQSPLGRVLKAIREDELLASAAGKNVVAKKVVIFSLSAGMAAMAGAFYAYYSGFIDPTSFTVNDSIFVIAIVIVGGAGTVWGPFFGAAILIVGPEILRFVGLPTELAANVRQILYGCLLVFILVLRPGGILGARSVFERASGR